MSLRDRLLQRREARKETLRVEAWEGPDGAEVWVEVREFSARDRILWRSRAWEVKRDADGQAEAGPDGEPLKTLTDDWALQLILLTTYDPETGQRLLSPEDAERLKDLPASEYDAVIEPLAGLLTAALDINGLTPRDKEDAADFTQAPGNSEPVSTSPRS